MLEKMKKINPKIGQLEIVSGCRSEVSGNEILLGAICCKPQYVELLINMHMHSSKKKIKFSLAGFAEYLHISVIELKQKMKDGGYKLDELLKNIRKLRNTCTISRTCEDIIYQDFYREYQDRLAVNDKKQLLDADEVFRIVRCAVIAYEQNITKDVDIYNMLEVSQSSWTTKYSTVFHNAVYFIHKELMEVAKSINKRLEK